MKGIVPSLNTPFDARVPSIMALLRKLVEHTVQAGCGGMLGLAVAGEYQTLTHGEKIAFIETVAEANAQRIPFIVSVTSPGSGGKHRADESCQFRRSGRNLRPVARRS